MTHLQGVRCDSCGITRTEETPEGWQEVTVYIGPPGSDHWKDYRGHVCAKCWSVDGHTGKTVLGHVNELLHRLGHERVEDPDRVA